MEVYLVRHGEAAAQTGDPRRPLTPAGRRDVERVAHAVATRGVSVSEIVHSGMLRAHQTAEIFSRVLNSSAVLKEVAGLKPDDDPFLAKAELDTAATPIMMVGHLPHLGRLAALLAGADPDAPLVEFTPATLVCFSHHERRWKIVWRITPASAQSGVDRQ